MTSPNALLERYLRQRRELGEVELVLERALDLATLGATVSPTAGPRPVRAPVPETRSVEARPPSMGAPALTDAGLAPPARPQRPAPRAAPAEPVAPPVRVGRDLPPNHPLTVLNVAASGCTACGLAASRTHVVFGEGNPEARLMVVGEAPGADEDRTGRPFVGRAGMLLNSLLQSIGLPRESVYICNVLKCRPPGNRNPQPVEVEACAHFLRGQLEAISPRAVLAVGTFPAQALLSTTEPIGRLRGKVHSFDGIPLVPTYHPAALLRNPGWIRPVWEDLQRLRQVLDAA